nr:hypothetical protein [Klebsiella pneumoniae]
MFTGFIEGSLKEIQSWCLKGTTRPESPTAGSEDAPAWP